MRCLRKLRDWTCHRRIKAQNAKSPLKEDDVHPDNTSLVLKSPFATQSSMSLTQLKEAPITDFWQAAFDQLSQEEQNVLHSSNGPASTNGKRTGQQLIYVIDNVIECTKQEYKAYQERGGMKIKRSNGDEIDLRQMSRKILNAALSFKDIIGVGVACDPTGHAASAWTIVSLGLTVSCDRKREYSQWTVTLTSDIYNL
jgi:hypothetical protein